MHLKAAGWIQRSFRRNFYYLNCIEFLPCMEWPNPKWCYSVNLQERLSLKWYQRLQKMRMVFPPENVVLHIATNYSLMVSGKKKKKKKEFSWSICIAWVIRTFAWPQSCVKGAKKKRWTAIGGSAFERFLKHLTCFSDFIKYIYINATATWGGEKEMFFSFLSAFKFNPKKSQTHQTVEQQLISLSGQRRLPRAYQTKTHLACSHTNCMCVCSPPLSHNCEPQLSEILKCAAPKQVTQTTPFPFHFPTHFFFFFLPAPPLFLSWGRQLRFIWRNETQSSDSLTLMWNWI